MEPWKKKRLETIEEFMANRDFILLRGPKSWNVESDVDIFCPTYPQTEDLSRYEYEGVKIDVFKNYKIKKFNIKYDFLKLHTMSHELDPNIERCIFYLKDYLHVSFYRKYKHTMYGSPQEMEYFLKQIGANKIQSYLLTPSYSSYMFYLKSFLIKLKYNLSR